MTNEAMKKVLIKASVFSFVSIALMLHRSATKHIMITDAAGTTVDRAPTESSYNLLVDKKVSARQQGKLIIPLSRNVGSDNIAMEDNYMDHELLIYIDGGEEGFYLDNAVKTDLDILEGAVCMTEGDSGDVCLEFKLDGLYANEITLTETSSIEVRFFRPYEEYDKVVVIDPMAGGEDSGVLSDTLLEKDVALDIALELKSQVDKAENNDIKFYFTRLSDRSVDSQRRSELLAETGADMLIGIGADKAFDGSGILTSYNDSYYIRNLDNAELADIMEKNCVAKAGANARGMATATEEDLVLMESRIPSCRVIAGNLGSNEDIEYLSNSAYTSKIAAGIYAGIAEAFESYY